MWSLFELEIDNVKFFVGCYPYALLTLALHIEWSETKWNRDILLRMDSTLISTSYKIFSLLLFYVVLILRRWLYQDDQSKRIKFGVYVLNYFWICDQYFIDRTIFWILQVFYMLMLYNASKYNDIFVMLWRTT